MGFSIRKDGAITVHHCPPLSTRTDQTLTMKGRANKCFPAALQTNLSENLPHKLNL